jgi:hypothetical protein
MGRQDAAEVVVEETVSGIVWEALTVVWKIVELEGLEGDQWRKVRFEDEVEVERKCPVSSGWDGYVIRDRQDKVIRRP